LVGYTPDGFIVQNSWGPGWGFKGFAILTFEDWVQHSSDAWVTVMGAAMAVRSARTFSTRSLIDTGAGKAGWSWTPEKIAGGFHYTNPNVQPLSESDAYEHALVLGNNGRAINRFLDVQGAGDAIQEVMLKTPETWLTKHGSVKLVLYAHGGLNSEEASIKRIRVMAPYFRENGIYPIFFTWKTGVLDSLSGILEDAAADAFRHVEERRAMGWIADIGKQLDEARDRSLELACEHLLAKPVWQQMKQNAGAAAMGDAGIAQSARLIAELQQRIQGLEIHLIGHSAGSILLGHLLDRLLGKIARVNTLTLFAPACTAAFANRYLGRAVEKGLIGWDGVHVDIMSDERELADTVGPYGKSLLYLVSRALEDVHKMPLLGMQAVWTDVRPDLWYIPDRIRRKPRDKWENPDVALWRGLVGTNAGKVLQVHNNKRVSDGVEKIPLAHGSFDNDRDVMTATIERILGGSLAAPIENLRGF
jgi:pimeloyl-ACP methyl ester carboxylesterase